ncbi:anhydro-N-acetylmuramic acid kinase [Glaciecola sp. MH2013]|uniref:anhydro-N-acetylmuramic acid kinase n=1 Tax=Glaciecola sp. MH2013 TaxID=2785524 RepID=UPI00189FEE74|nr:anhydro-N-acetylmuramic acid kinase [Glaciecola sp. MH2013]MBF7072529.1 anhydro-N-acetylmuramic acid kinase [Glaciecola sp. MH2013]
MRQHIDKLYGLTRAKTRRIIGLMSGTSLDGLDIALCTIDGHGKATRVRLEGFETKAYDDAFLLAVKDVFSKQIVDQSVLCWLNAFIARTHADMVLQFLEDNKLTSADVDLIASHGQTVFHYPNSLRVANSLKNVSRTPCPAQTESTYLESAANSSIHSTLQLGDGDHIASLTHIITISDFRQKQIAHGGEGAPLAMYGDYLLFSSHTKNRCLINIGGIANLTYLPKGAGFNDTVCSDLGPGNTLMDALIRAERDKSNEQSEQLAWGYDKDGKIAAMGKVNTILLKKMQDDAFVNAAMPKTTGPELFNIAWLDNAVSQSDTDSRTATPMQLDEQKSISFEDKMATLNEFSAWLIAKHVLCLPIDTEIYVSGGGARNTHLLNRLSFHLKRSVSNTRALDIDPDAKEAILFALLANECVAGDIQTFAAESATGSKGSTNVNTSMGKISLPQ